jgi:hypothetical protein
MMAKANLSKISPSPEARKLFNAMVASADKNLNLSLRNTLNLSVKRSRAGIKDKVEVDQLIQEGWIKPRDDGGWRLK